MSVFGKRTATLCVLLLLFTLGGSYAVAVSPQVQPAVEDFSVDVAEGSVEVTVTATEDVEYTYFSLDGPRLVLDFHNAENRLDFSRKVIGVAGLKQVRTAPFSDQTRNVTRVVFDLAEGTTYRVMEEQPGSVRVTFGEPAVGPEEPAVQAAMPGRPHSETSDVGSGESAPVPDVGVEASETVPGVVSLGDDWAPETVQIASLVPTAGFQTVAERSEPEQVATVDVKNEPAIAGGEAIEADPTTPAATTVASREVRAAPAASPTSEAASPTSETAVSSILESQDFPEPDLATLGGAPGPPVPSLSTQVVSPLPVPEYTGEIYDFDLRGVELQDFFRTVSDLSGLNVILDPNIPNQQLTMMLYQVPWDQALDIVLRNYNLAWELNGNVLRIASQDTLRAEEERRRQYRELQEQNGPLVNNTYILSYAQAGTAAELIDDLLSDRGTVVPVQERNALIVTDIENRFDSISRMIDFLDTPSQQVEIEARLLQANKTFRRDLGNQLGLIINNNGSNVVTGVPTLPSPFERNPAPSATAGGGNALPLVADFGISAPVAGLSYLLGVGGDVLLDEVIQVAESRGTARLLSRPNVVVQNNEPAIIEQGTQIPVQTNVNNTITVQFQQFALRLEVTPQITEEGTILLNAIIENSTPDFSQQVDGIPSIATQRAQTRVLIDDGATAMVGGILIDSDSVSVSQVPGLGNIPLLGNLFKSTSTIKGTSELLFFVTARIKPAGALNFLSDAGRDALATDFSENLLQQPPGEVPELAGPGLN